MTPPRRRHDQQPISSPVAPPAPAPVHCFRLPGNVINFCPTKETTEWGQARRHRSGAWNILCLFSNTNTEEFILAHQEYSIEHKPTGRNVGMVLQSPEDGVFNGQLILKFILTRSPLRIYQVFKLLNNVYGVVIHIGSNKFTAPVSRLPP